MYGTLNPNTIRYGSFFQGEGSHCSHDCTVHVVLLVHHGAYRDTVGVLVVRLVRSCVTRGLFAPRLFAMTIFILFCVEKLRLVKTKEKNAEEE